MKTLEKFAAQKGLQVIPITYKYNGIPVRTKGFDLIDKDRRIFASFEPVYYTYYKSKWLLRTGNYEGKTTLFDRITMKVLKGLTWPEYPDTLIK